MVYKASTHFPICCQRGEHILRDVFVRTAAANVARVATRPVLLVKYEWDKARHSVRCIWDVRRVFDNPLIALDFLPCSDSIVEAVNKLFGDYAKRVTHACHRLRKARGH